MKTLIVFLFSVFLMNTGQAQKVIQLKEAKVEFAPYTVRQGSDLDTYEVLIEENYTGQFSSNALKFVRENVNINDIIKSINKPGYDGYLISFRSSKGFLEIAYNKNGEMKNSNQMFKDVLLPLEIRREVYTNYKGWTMVKNKYVASGNEDKLDREIYRINLKKDNKRQNVKIIPGRIGSDRVVSN